MMHVRVLFALLLLSSAEGTCPPGKYRNGTFCAICAEGTFNSNGLSATCSPALCKPGTFNKKTSAACLTCPAHHYQSGTRRSHCDACPAGRYVYRAGATRVEHCCPLGVAGGTGLLVRDSIDGEGCILDGQGQRRGFVLGSNANVTNVTFVNGYADKGAAIKIRRLNEDLGVVAKTMVEGIPYVLVNNPGGQRGFCEILGFTTVPEENWATECAQAYTAMRNRVALGVGTTEDAAFPYGCSVQYNHVKYNKNANNLFSTKTKHIRSVGHRAIELLCRVPIDASSSSESLINVIVSNCHFGHNIGASGAGIYLSWMTAKAVITKCRFDSNAAQQGSALYFTHGASATANLCVFDQNKKIVLSPGQTSLDGMVSTFLPSGIAYVLVNNPGGQRGFCEILGFITVPEENWATECAQAYTAMRNRVALGVGTTEDAAFPYGCSVQYNHVKYNKNANNLFSTKTKHIRSVGHRAIELLCRVSLHSLGAAVTLSDTSIVSVTDCLFQSNGGEYSRGGAISVVASTINRYSLLQISRSTFIDNRAKYGGGIWLDANDTIAQLDSCVFQGNTNMDDTVTAVEGSVGIMTLSNIHIHLRVGGITSDDWTLRTGLAWRKMIELPQWFRLSDRQNVLENAFRNSVSRQFAHVAATCMVASNTTSLANTPVPVCTRLIGGASHPFLCVATANRTCHIPMNGCASQRAPRGILGKCDGGTLEFSSIAFCGAPRPCPLGWRLKKSTTGHALSWQNATRILVNGSLPVPDGRTPYFCEQCRDMPGHVCNGDSFAEEPCPNNGSIFCESARTTPMRTCPIGKECTTSFFAFPCKPKFICPNDGTTYRPVLCENNTAGTCCPGDTGHPCDCSPGRYQDRPTQSSCEACPKGTYISTHGASVCKVCPQHYSQLSAGKGACIACRKGTFQTKLGETECEQCSCSDETFDHGGNCTCNSRCSQCIAGEYEVGACTSSTNRQCAYCPVNWFSLSGEAKVCLKCNNDNEYTPHAGASECTACALNAVANKAKTSCECGTGYFEVGFQARPNATTLPAECNTALNKRRGCCVDIPAGSFAVSGRLLVRQGYWLKPETLASSTPLLMLCPTQEACLGSDPGGSTANGTTTQASKCADGHVGFLCDTCNTGWRKGGVDGMCKYCPNAAPPGDMLAKLLSISSMIVGSGLFAYLLRMAQRRRDGKHVEQDAKQMSEHGERLATFKAQFFTLTSFAQVVSSFGYTFRASYGGNGVVGMSLSPSVLSACSALSIFTGDALRLLSGAIPCSTSLPFDYRLASMLAMLPLLVGIIRVAHRLAMCVVWPSKAVREQQHDVAVQLSNTVIFFLWPTVSSAIVSVFAFTDAGGTYLLTADLTVALNSSAWASLAVVGVIAAIVFVLGIPAMYYVVLKRRRHRLKASFGILFVKYEPQYWYFELVFMFYKFLMTSFVLVLQTAPLVQALMAILIAFVFAVLLAHTRPYADTSVDKISLVGACTTWLLLMLGSANTYWFQSVPPGQVHGSRAVVTSLSMAAVVGSILVPLMVMLRPWVSRAASCGKGPGKVAKVVPMATPGTEAKLDTPDDAFNPDTCTDWSQMRAEYAKIKAEYESLRKMSGAKTLTRNNTIQKSQLLVISQNNRLKNHSSIDTRQHKRRHLTDENHAKLIIKEHREEHAASQRQLAQAQEKSADLGTHKRLLKEIRHRMRGRVLAEVLESTLGLTGDDHIIALDQAVRLFEAIVERPLDHAVVKKSLVRCDKNGDGCLDLDELRRIAGQQAEEAKDALPASGPASRAGSNLPSGAASAEGLQK